MLTPIVYKPDAIRMNHYCTTKKRMPLGKNVFDIVLCHPATHLQRKLKLKRQSITNSYFACSWRVCVEK